MVEQKSLEWKQQYAQEAAIPRHIDRNVVLKKNLMTRITYRALDLIHEQYVMASSARLGTQEIGECTGAFTAQLGLPCKHTIYNMLRVETSASENRKVATIRSLELRDVCKYWRLPNPLEDIDPLLLEEDPRVVAHRGRPRNAPEDGIMLWLGTSLTGVGGHLVSGFFFFFFFFVGFCLLKGKRPKKFFYYHFDLSYTVCLNSVVPYWNPAE